MVTADSTDTVQIWDVVSPAQPQLLIQPFSGKSNGGIDSLAFSPDGHTLITGDNNGIVQLWNIPTAVLADSSGGAITSMAFSPNDRVLASVDSNGSARLWNVTNPAVPRPLSLLPTARNQQVTSLIYSPDGRTIAGLQMSGQTGSVQLWDVADPTTPKPLGQPLTNTQQGGINSFAFSPYGRTVAIASSDTIQLWNISNLEDPRLGSLITGGSNGEGAPIAAMAFSPNGRVLASIDYSGAIDLWDVIHPALEAPIDSASASITTDFGIASPMLEYSPDGRTLTVQTEIGTVELWNVASPGTPGRLRQLPATTTGLVTAIAVSRQGTLATDDEDGAIQLWTSANPANPQPFGQPIAGNSFVTSVTFSPDGTMAGGTSAGTIFLWNLHVNDAIKRICATAGGNLTPQNWRQYVPELPYQTLCRQ